MKSFNIINRSLILVNIITNCKIWREGLIETDSWMDINRQWIKLLWRLDNLRLYKINRNILIAGRSRSNHDEIKHKIKIWLNFSGNFSHLSNSKTIEQVIDSSNQSKRMELKSNPQLVEICVRNVFAMFKPLWMKWNHCKNDFV